MDRHCSVHTVPSASTENKEYLAQPAESGAGVERIKELGLC